jgi:hypothetical protein
MRNDIEIIAFGQVFEHWSSDRLLQKVIAIGYSDQALQIVQKGLLGYLMIVVRATSLFGLRGARLHLTLTAT